MIVVKQVKTVFQKRQFLNFALKLYKGNKCFVPPLYGDERRMFHKTYMYHETSKSIFFNAYDGHKMVGRIQGIIQYDANKKYNQKRVRFTRFDCINNQEVANCLFRALLEWGKSEGMNEIVGPLGYSDLEREGLLIEGFDELSTFEEQYNYPYYQKLIENFGFNKEVDWEERKLYLPNIRHDKFNELGEAFFKKYDLHFGEAKTTKEFIKKYGDQFFNILDETYFDIYGTVPFTLAMKRQLMDSFKIMVDPHHVVVVLNKEDKVVAFGICFPNISKALQGTKGHLTPLSLWHLIKAIKHPEILDLGLIGVSKYYKGVSSAILNRLMEFLKEHNIKYCETNLNLETNVNILSLWKYFDAVYHKRRRCYVKGILGGTNI
jgi:hypothetical protein